MVDLELVDPILERTELTRIAEGKASDSNLNSGLGFAIAQAAQPCVKCAALEDLVHGVTVNCG